MLSFKMWADDPNVNIPETVFHVAMSLWDVQCFQVCLLMVKNVGGTFKLISSSSFEWFFSECCSFSLNNIQNT